MHVVIFEGSYWTTFAPLSLSRPIFMLATGMSTLLEKQIRRLRPTRLTLWVRPELAEHCRLRVVPKMSIPTAVNEPLDDEPAILASGRTLPIQDFEYPGQSAVAVGVAEGEEIVIHAQVRMPGLNWNDALMRTGKWMEIFELPRTEPQMRIVESLWDLIKWNEESLIEDSTKLAGKCFEKPGGAYHMVNEADVCLGQQVSLAPGVVLDASKGPVVIGDKVKIGANSIVTGPCYVGPYAQVRGLSLIREGSSIGTMSKVGGEISNSIFLGWSNKAHDGFLGDSYIGKWVNMGAGTTTSNLKNTYGEITMKIGSREIPTGQRFLGTVMGDHSKTAIMSRLMAGSYIGFCCMIATEGSVPRFVPSFTFLTQKGPEPYRMDKAIEMIQRVFARRDRQWTGYEERMMQYISTAAPAVEK